MNIFRATLFFSASASCSKILNDKKISLQWKIPGRSVYQGKSKLLKTPECKSIFNTVKNFWATLFFQGERRCSKILNSKKYIQCSEKFQEKLCFQGKRKLLKILNVKGILTTVKFFRATLLFSGQEQVAQKSWTVKKYSIQCNSLGGDPCNLG